MFCCSVIVDRPDRGGFNPGSSQHLYSVAAFKVVVAPSCFLGVFQVYLYKIQHFCDVSFSSTESDDVKPRKLRFIFHDRDVFQCFCKVAADISLPQLVSPRLVSTQLVSPQLVSHQLVSVLLLLKWKMNNLALTLNNIKGFSTIKLI